ncbi:Zinc finger protein with KRAB and SCAN domains 3 [Zalerion maritima]|uniref:Zinc finger protein with KRAB and SCAN domains 3 n=1 Tax=Zalerion maritima TaxID=339359 RepID=A0AAD5RQQ3_9PEZI|nr:Zinc finger protein with KRAB and SCAN domains 3 [Zalerion maritima]
MAQIPSMTQMVLGSDRPDSPHGSEHSRFSTPQIPPPQMPPYGNSPTVMAAQLPSSMPPQMHMLAPMAGGMPPQAPPAPQKQYSCSTCPKSFTRRSDLARHERIHSGVRPHACEHPGCGKRFIQRSALTVHVRVHTGEKPHMCEHCSKTFSDSSSLARHRRIHSGKRPYKCPYADCQKTFTRRTTLTRHQNHHTGTVEEAAAQTRAALAAARAKTQSEAGDHMSGHPSPMSTPSPNQTRPLSTSPSLEIAGTPNSLQREFPALSHLNQPGLPTHVRNDIYHSGPAQTSAPYNQPMRPTSHPMSFPPPTLEPSAEPSHSNPGSQTGSPHMSHVSGGWQSPQPGAQSPAHSQPGGAYTYPEPDYAANAYFQSAAGIRRPDSAQSGSGGYDVKPRNEVWAGAH